MDSYLEPWMLQVIKEIEAEDKWRLEGTYGVEIHPDSLPLCCRIITSHSDEASNHEKGRLLKGYMVNLLDAVCHKFISSLQMVAEEDGLDIEYLLHRACVELFEFEKEKEHCHLVWLPHVRKEYAELMDKWHKFEETWKPVLMSQCTPQIGDEEICMLRQVQEELAFCLQNEQAIGNGDIVSRMFEQLGALRTKIELSIGKDIKQILMVGPTEIEEATRELVCIPALGTSKFLKPHYQNLETRLVKRLTGQEHAIRIITNALTQPRSGKGPVRSFLFICGCNAGCEEGKELARALAEEVFYDKERLIELDVSENAKLNCHGAHNVKGELTDSVKKKPHSVIFLRNIHRADASITDFLLEILRDGRITDEKGRLVDFSKTLFLMISCVLASTDIRLMYCDCASKAENLPLEELEDHGCRFLSLVKHTKQCLKPDLLGAFDKWIVFEFQPIQQYGAFARKQLRNMASKIGGGRLILYPTEAALSLDAAGFDHGRIRTWLEENVAPKLLDICDGARMVRSIVYLDYLVGAKELSYRVEIGGCRVGSEESELFLANLWKAKDIYEKEIQWWRTINGLRRTLQMIDGISNTNASMYLDFLADEIESLLISETGMNAVLWNLQDIFFWQLEQPFQSDPSSTGNKFARPQQKKGPKRTNKKDTETDLEVLRTRLNNRLIHGHYVFDTVTRVLLNCIDYYIRSHVTENRSAFLLLGLTTSGKEDLLKKLTELLVGENGTNLMVQINSSECTEFDKFFNLIYTNHKPCGVLFVDKVEMAPMSVFSGLLRLLDHGTLSGDRGRMVDLRHTAIILVSDLGNRDFIAEMFKPKSETLRKACCIVTDPDESSWEEYMKQPERKRFRSELLNRVDEIVFFNPCACDGEQLTNFARLPMRGGPHIDSGPPHNLTSSLQQLFHEGDHKREPYFSQMVAMDVHCLSSGILRS